MTVQAPNEIDPESFEGIKGGFRLNKPIRTVACFSLLQRCAMNGVKQINLVCAHNRRRALPLTFYLWLRSPPQVRATLLTFEQTSGSGLTVDRGVSRLKDRFWPAVTVDEMGKTDPNWPSNTVRKPRMQCVKC